MSVDGPCGPGRVLTALGFMIDAHTLPYMHILSSYAICMVSVLTGRIPVSWLNVLVAAGFFRTPGQLLAVFYIAIIIINYYYYYRMWFIFADDTRAKFKSMICVIILFFVMIIDN